MYLGLKAICFEISQTLLEKKDFLARWTSANSNRVFSRAKLRKMEMDPYCVTLMDTYAGVGHTRRR